MASLLGKTQIAANTANLTDGDSIAAYLTAAAGALITSTTLGSKVHLDAKLASELVGDTVSAFGTDLGASILAVRHDANTSLATADGNYAPLQLDANGALKVSASITLTDLAEHAEDSAATSGDMGISTLLVRQDSLASSTSADGDYGNFKSNAKGELYIHDTDVLAQLISANSTLTSISSSAATTATNTGTTATNTGTTATNTSTIATNSGTIATNTGSTSTTLSALSKAEDAAHSSGDQGIQALAVRKDAQGSTVNGDGDYASLQVWSEGSLKVVNVANAAVLQQQVSVTSTAAALPASSLANRKSLMIQNTGSSKCWVGSATVTSSGATAGIELPANSFMELEAGPACILYAVKSGAGSNTVNVLEMA